MRCALAHWPHRSRLTAEVSGNPQMREHFIALVAAVVLPASLAHAHSWDYGSMSKASTGIDANLNGAVPFPLSNAWNTDISQQPVDPNSNAIIASIGASTGLHPDFGSGTYGHAIIGIPYVVVDSSQAPVAIKIKGFKGQSDPGPFPVPSDAKIEGYKP